MIAKMLHLKNGNRKIWKLPMVAYAITMSDLANIKVVMTHGLGAIINNVKNFAKRHVINANHFRSNHFHTLPTLTTNYELNNG